MLREGSHAPSSSEIFFPGDMDSVEDRLSIGLDSFFAILDEDLDSPSICEEDYRENLAEVNCYHAEASPLEDGYEFVSNLSPSICEDEYQESQVEENRYDGQESPPEDGFQFVSLQHAEELERYDDDRLNSCDASLNENSRNSSLYGSFCSSSSRNEDGFIEMPGGFTDAQRQEIRSEVSGASGISGHSSFRDSFSHFEPIKFNGTRTDNSTTTESNFQEIWQSAPYLSDEPGLGTTNSFTKASENGRNGDWIWNFPNKPQSNQLSPSFSSCHSKYALNLYERAEREDRTSPQVDSSFPDPDYLSKSTGSCSRKKDILNSSLRSLPSGDSLSLYLSSSLRTPLPCQSKRLMPDSIQFIQNKKQNIVKEWSRHSNVDVVRSRSFANGVDSPDVCVIDVDLPKKGLHSEITPTPYSYVHQSRTSSSKLQTDDDKLAFRIALQDLAQPKLEASVPEGVLSVPLLRHQRIALSWMVQKETRNHYCSGGILADDQGLGKTVSTIALILLERSPASKSCVIPAKGEIEALALDDEEEIKRESSCLLQKGRPAAGTLVVCPTSVLRQWADELKRKVTSNANLSFVVYHGSNRTRDPQELAKYDVVLTTYSIVSLEVPTRSDAGDGEVKGRVSSVAEHKKVSSFKQKKALPEDASLHSAARPLAKVGWFRVILDEAQTIKNHRTQVARACWGLRAKRRWCLSGTPIQNAIDDLYSYFRFLRYEPFVAYTSFCSGIKVPINKNPEIGYKKLQAVLKTVMLRRTKGTLIDGKPIINLPPKIINLKKIEFSAPERDFYSRLEADSQEKFKGYADAGTVKQNYVNILLMLLRLRQACGHPLLVRGCNSSSVWKTAMEKAEKLPREQQMKLLSCLESSLALCSRCKDPPEDAIVTICGHVFCNQCISEHLTGDGDSCPAAKCRVKLTRSSVFSKPTLKTCLFGPQVDGQEPPEMPEPLFVDAPSYSSKIRAAVDTLRSLPKYEDSGSKNKTSTLPTDDKVMDSSGVSLNNDMANTNRSKELVSEKAIVFSQWTRMLDLLESELKNSSVKYRRLDGTMSVSARDKAVTDFNTLPEVTVMIMSLKAASLGLNMVAACHVMLMDLWWNPTTEDQAIDRAHRIGQTRPVTVSRLTVENTVEDRILALQEKKREMVASAFGEDGSGTHRSRLTLEDLRYLFRV
ncbi:helicase-like transcription factor CHR28 isoform X2 [Wolffia australiana]